LRSMHDGVLSLAESSSLKNGSLIQRLREESSEFRNYDISIRVTEGEIYFGDLRGADLFLNSPEPWSIECDEMRFNGKLLIIEPYLARMELSVVSIYLPHAVYRGVKYILKQALAGVPLALEEFYAPEVTSYLYIPGTDCATLLKLYPERFSNLTLDLSLGLSPS
jgi:hypothetical protein